MEDPLLQFESIIVFIHAFPLFRFESVIGSIHTKSFLQFQSVIGSIHVHRVYYQVLPHSLRLDSGKLNQNCVLMQGFERIG